MDTQSRLFLFGVFAIHVRPLDMQGARWDAEYQITHRDTPVQPWTRIGGAGGFASADEAVDAAHRQAVADIEQGVGIPKPQVFP